MNKSNKPVARRRARANGEGTIRQRADGRWEGKLTLGFDDQGKQQRKSIYGKTRAEVAQKLAALQVEHHKGESVSRGEVSLIAYLTAFARTRAAFVRPSTRSNHDQYLKILAGQPIAKLPLSELRSRHAEQLYTTLSQTYSDSVVTHVRIFINQAVKDAIKNEIGASNSILQAKAPTKRDTAPAARALTDEEIKTLLEHLGSSRLRVLVRTILALGLRIGEALALTWDDYDEQAQTIRIDRTMTRTGDHIDEGPTKTRAGRRTLYVTPALARAWAEWREVLRAEALFANYIPNNLIFPNIRGRPAAYRLIRRDFQIVCTKAGLGNVRLHDLRHTFATRLILRGADPRTVSALLGHTDARVTLAIYTHAQTETSKAALLLVDEE